MNLHMSGVPPLFSTGLPALDRVLGGGIPTRQVLLIAGQPGSGKTLLASQVAFAQAERGVPVLLATAASEPHTKLLESLQGFSFFNRDRVGREIFLLSVYPWLRKGVREAREMLLSSIRERRARLLVVDGLRSLRDVWREEAPIREFLAEVGVGLSSNDCTGLFTLEAAPERILELPEAATVDGVLTLGYERTGMARARRLEVVKVRGRSHLAGGHSASLGPSGFTLWPRLESLEGTEEKGQGALPAPDSKPRRVSLGFSGLDEHLGGGVSAGTVTALFGQSGGGKSVLAMAFARAGAAAAERTLFVSLQDDVESLADRALNLGVPLEQSEMLDLWSPAAIEVDADALAHAVLERAAKSGASRIVIDGAEVIDEALVPPARRHDFWMAFTRRLRASGRNVLLACTSPASEAPPFSRVVDNLFEAVLREEDRALVRELRAIKLRSGAAPGRSWRFDLQPPGARGSA